MKTRLIVLSALALVALAACQREAKVADNPTYDPQENTVKTQFVMSVSTGTGKDTKTTAEMAQVGDDAKFLGMDQVHLLAYHLDDSYKTPSHGHYFFKTMVEKDGQSTPVAAVRDFNLGTLFGEGAISSSKSSRTVELALPLGTNALLFYGKATKTYSDDLQGYTQTEGDIHNLGSIKYSLKSRLTDAAAFQAGAAFFSGILTYFTSTGLVNEETFWARKAGSNDRSYGFWWPIPSDTELAALPTNPTDQLTATAESESFTYYAGEVSWKQMGEMYYYENDGIESTTYADANVKTKGGSAAAVAMDYVPLVEAMGSAYNALTTIKTAQQGEQTLQELRAGSCSSVLRICQDLYAIAERCANSTPTSWSEQCAKLMAEQLESRMKTFFMMQEGQLTFLRNNDGIDIGALKSANEIATANTPWADQVPAVNQYLDKDYFYDNSDPKNIVYGFPINVGLPYGASIMTCTTTGENTGVVKPAARKHVDVFTYTTDIPAYGMGGATFPIKNYRYPPELMYYGNSSIRVSNEVKENYPTSVLNWNDDGLWTDWTKHGAVTSSTRSVAMTNNINYGTALLKSDVKYADGVTTLEDNNANLHPGEENIEIPIDGLLVTGIIIGGQPDVVGWDYVRRPDNAETFAEGYDETEKKFTGGVYTDNPFDKMVYDRVVGGYKVGSSTTPIYTMLWDNYDATKAADDQSDVYVAIELLNNTGKDFWGEMNLIRQSGVFYLVGKIDLSAATNLNVIKSGISRTDYCYPPFNPTNGATIEAPRVFMQDYMTTASLILTKTSLQHAYVTVPDLRSSQISLGVSIDMEWKPGLAFEVEMGKLD